MDGRGKVRVSVGLSLKGRPFIAMGPRKDKKEHGHFVSGRHPVPLRGPCGGPLCLSKVLVGSALARSGKCQCKFEWGWSRACEQRWDKKRCLLLFL